MVLEEKSFEGVVGRRASSSDDAGAFPSYNLPGALGSGELEKLIINEIISPFQVKVNEQYFW